MKCKHYQNQIILYFYNELSGIEERNLLKHIETCSECREELDKNKKFFNIFEEPDEDESKTDWEEQWKIIEKGVKINKPETLLKSPSWRWGTAAAASFLLLLLGFLAGRFLFSPQQNGFYAGDNSGNKTRLLYVNNYFEDIKPVLLDYANYSPSPEGNGGPVDKKIIESMLSEARLIKRRISTRNSPYLSALFEDLEMILIEIRNITPGDTTSLRFLQNMIKTKSLPLKIDLFKNKTRQFEKI